MASYQYYVVDAFASARFGGNPAAVVLCPEEAPQALCVAMAKELAQPAVAFVAHPDILKPSFATSALQQLPTIKWFSSLGNQIPLCGHATMATSILLLSHLFPALEKLTYIFPTAIMKDDALEEGTSRITATKEADGRIGIFLPAANAPVELPEEEKVETMKILNEAFGVEEDEIISVGRTFLDDPSIHHLIVHLSPELDLASIKVQTEALKALPDRGIYATSQWPDTATPEQKKTFRSRVFFPSFGIDEDQVCGSAHTLFAGYWTLASPALATDTPDRLSSSATAKPWKALEGDQVSARRGALGVLWNGEFGAKNGLVCLLGTGKVMMKGEMYVD